MKTLMLLAMTAAFSPSPAFATLIDFRVDPYTAAVNVGLNDEVVGNEWVGVAFC